MSDCWFEKGLAFECARCSKCCRGKPGFVFLSQTDLTNLVQFFNLNSLDLNQNESPTKSHRVFSESDFIKKYCRIVEWHDGSSVLSLIERKNGDCVFWKDGCTVYQNRPVQCRTYPFWKWIIRDEKTWLQEKTECDGINRGSVKTKSEILEMMQQHALNKPRLQEKM